MATSFHVAGLCPSASQFLNDDFQRGLARWNRERLSPQMIEPDWADRLVSEPRMLRLEGAFLEELRHAISAQADRKRSVWGKRVSIRVIVGGRSTLTKKIQ